MSHRNSLLITATLCLILLPGANRSGARDAVSTSEVAALVREFCVECHGGDHIEAGIDLQSLSTDSSFGTHFRDWQKVAARLEAGTMPPRDAVQPTKSQRQQLIDSIRSGIRRAADLHAGDPGHVLIRRLTSAEYACTIRDLTGLDLNLERSFVGDAVGGAGFTNTGIAQFVQDSTLERYLEAARQIADHAVIGAGPLVFYQDPGQTGFELSAVSRINSIYRTYGFRPAAGEGGEAFGMQRYPDAFYTAWLFRHRQRLNLGNETMASLANRNGVAVRFAEYVYSVLSDDSHAFPLSDIATRWRSLPVPNGADPGVLASVRHKCDAIVTAMLDWQNRFGENPDAKEEAPVLSDRSFDISETKSFVMNINWPVGTRTAHLVLSVESANQDGNPDAVIVWKEPAIVFRIDDEILKDPQPLRRFLAPAVVRRLGFGTHPRGGAVGPNDFVTVGTKPPAFELPVIPGARSAQLLVTAQLDIEHGENCIVRCAIAQLEETDQGKSVSGLLANSQRPGFRAWQEGVLEFAWLMPQVSQREPAPSDRDPIPPPFDSSYNNPERNYYHSHIKYHRDDAFLVRNILDDAVREQLDQAWLDLLGSFEFHDLWLRFVCGKFGIELDGRRIGDIDSAWIDRLPSEPRDYIRRLRRQHQSIQSVFQLAQPGHVDDVMRFAALAWRRPLLSSEERGLLDFYATLRTTSGLDHDSALRALISRVLVAPDFVYRAERTPADGDVSPLDDWELASRLSYFLWSSSPDAELRQAAVAGRLSDPDELIRQSQRMLQDPKARRFAAEFFGQWFGFYRFDQHRGIDPQRFPEFSESLKAAMHGEAVEFFSYIVQQDRPVSEILFADYTFMNAELAKHYGIDDSISSPAGDPFAWQRVDRLNGQHRGGLLRLGAVLAVTSAPLRTSPVKRGDWILRRVLGTPVPPPPADAGSISADDVQADGQSIRQRLEAHRRDTSCANCHARFDALGFALEQFDPLGRWRETYRDGNTIDTSGELKGEIQIAGESGLYRYLRDQQTLFHATLCRKLLGYALGRRESIGDLLLLEHMAADLSSSGSMSQLVQRIVTSRPFRFHGRTE